MKKLNLLFVSMMALLAVSCSETGTGSSDDANDNANSYDGAGLYFPSENTSYYSFESDAVVTEFSVTIARTGETDEAKDYDIVVTDTASLFTVGPLSFEIGATEATVKVTYNGKEDDIRYGLILSVEADANEYSENAYVMSFSAARETWKAYVGPNGETTGIWCDEFMGVYFVSSYHYPEKEIEVEYTDAYPGWYRIKNIYDREYLTAILGFDPDDSTSGYNVIYEASDSNPVYTYIDATDPDKVYFPMQSIGVIVNESDEGHIYIGSIVSENGITGSTYGTLVDGYFNFPASTLFVYLELAPDYLYYGNEDGEFYVTLPGGSIPADPNAKPIANGEYSVACMYGQTSGTTNFTLTSNPTNTSKFTITGLFDLDATDDVVFNCTLDTSNHQLKVTPDVGFLNGYAYVDPATEAEAYVFLGDGDSGDDAWTINLKIDGDNYVPVDFNCVAELAIASLTTYYITDSAAYINSGSAITYEGASTSSVAAAPARSIFASSVTAKMIGSTSKKINFNR